MIYLLAATAPMYFEPISYYTSKIEAAGVAAYLNAYLDHLITDFSFNIYGVPKKTKVADILKAFKIQTEEL